MDLNYPFLDSWVSKHYVQLLNPQLVRYTDASKSQNGIFSKSGKNMDFLLSIQRRLSSQPSSSSLSQMAFNKDISNTILKTSGVMTHTTMTKSSYILLSLCTVR